MKPAIVATLALALVSLSAFGEEDTGTARQKGCKDSLVNRFPGSRIEDCYSFVWAQHPFSAGSPKEPTQQIVAGAFEQTIYAMDPKQSGLQVLRNFETALTKAGFKIVHTSGSGNHRRLTAQKDEDGKKLWVGFSSGYTNERIWVPLTLVRETPLPMRLATTQGPPPGKKDQETCKESKSLPRFAGSTLQSCQHKDFDELEMTTAADETKEMKEGFVFTGMYLQDATTSRSELFQTYAAYFKKHGFEQVLFEGEVAESVEAEREYWLAVKRDTGQRSNIELYTSTDVNGVYLNVKLVEAEQMEQVLEVSAASLLEDLRKNGRVAVYGINFDTNKATITKDSEKVLSEVHKLLADNADLKLKIEGHTDNVGKPKANLALSKKRAAAVKAWLAKKGVVATRLTTDGYGDTKPLADNKDDQGKAKNRRVELVRVD